MILEVIGAIVLGVLVLWLVFEPSRRSAASVAMPPEPEAPEETRRGIALLALKEIEFDRATGKLSDRDYEMLKERYAAEAIAALDAEERSAPPELPADPEQLVAVRLQVLRSGRESGGEPSLRSCITCGPRPEPDARFCSRCGRSLEAAGFCGQCGAPIEVGSRFCAACGSRVAA
jgi:hypothetical protein